LKKNSYFAFDLYKTVIVLIMLREVRAAVAFISKKFGLCFLNRLSVFCHFAERFICFIITIFSLLFTIYQFKNLSKIMFYYIIIS